MQFHRYDVFDPYVLAELHHRYDSSDTQGRIALLSERTGRGVRRRSTWLGNNLGTVPAPDRRLLDGGCSVRRGCRC